MATLLFAVACDSDDAGGGHEARCGTLCEEQTCGGDSRSACIDDCVAQSDGLAADCVQCLVDDSFLTVRRELGNGDYCELYGSGQWWTCVGMQCGWAAAGGACEDESLPSSCELQFGQITDCADFCD